MLTWKKTGQTVLSIGYFVTLLCLFTYVVIQGPIVGVKTDPGAQSILQESLFPFSLQDTGLFESRAFTLAEFFFQIFIGFLGAYLMGRTFQRIFELGSISTLLVTLIFLSPYYSPLVFGIYIINNGYAYPLFLMTTRYLVHGLVFREFSAYIKFFVFTTIVIIMRRQFMFLPIVGLASLVYSFIFDAEIYYGRKIYLTVCFLLSIILPDLSERTTTYLENGSFVSVPFAGYQFFMTPLYVSTEEDATLFQGDTLAGLFSSARELVLSQGLTEENLIAEQGPALMSRFQNYFSTYDLIAYGQLKPLIDSLAQENPQLVDEGLIAISMALIYNNFSDYILVYTHNIIYHMGGYYMTGLLLLIFITSFVYHIQHRGRFSLVSLILTFMTFSNYILVALLEPVTQEYGFYTDALTQALLFSLLAFLFKSQRGKNRVDEWDDQGPVWKGVEKPAA